jgi:hypothetical protein
VIHLGLNRAEWDELIVVMTTTHRFDIRAWLEDRSGNQLEDLSGMIAGGGITVDATQALPAADQRFVINPKGATRTVQAQIFDPDFDVDLGGAIFLQRLFCVDLVYWLPIAARWVDVPVCRAPIVSAQRTGPTIDINGIGKAALCNGSTLETHTLRKGLKVVDAIRYCLHTMSGIAARDIDLPDLPATLTRDWNLRVNTTAWVVIAHLANSIERDIFFDGAGIFHLRSTPTESLFEFSDKMVLSYPTKDETFYEGNFLQIPNVASVFGAHTKIHAIAYADPRSVISMQNMAVNGVDYPVLGVYENVFVNNQDVIERVAQRVVDRYLATALTYSFDAPMMPIFDEDDRVSVSAFGLHAEWNLLQYSFPLSTQDSPVMNVGHKKRVTFSGAWAP